MPGDELWRMGFLDEHVVVKYADVRPGQILHNVQNRRMTHDRIDPCKQQMRLRPDRWARRIFHQGNPDLSLERFELRAIALRFLAGKRLDRRNAAILLVAGELI